MTTVHSAAPGTPDPGTHTWVASHRVRNGLHRGGSATAQPVHLLLTGNEEKAFRFGLSDGASSDLEEERTKYMIEMGEPASIPPWVRAHLPKPIVTEEERFEEWLRMYICWGSIELIDEGLLMMSVDPDTGDAILAPTARGAVELEMEMDECWALN